MKHDETPVLEAKKKPMEVLERFSHVVSENIHRLSFDHKVVFFFQTLVGIFCFFPWISLAPLYGMWLTRNAFQGETWLMGIVLFCVSFGVFFHFFRQIKSQDLPEKHPYEGIFLCAACFLSLLTLVFSWSVLSEVQGGYEDAEIGYGLGGALFCQVLACVGAWQLKHQKHEKIKPKQPHFDHHHLFHHEE